MSFLTKKEIAFIEALKKDFEKNGEKSFLEVLYSGELSLNNVIRKQLNHLFNDSYKKLFDNSDLLIESIDSIYIGKYKETFWGTGSEGEVFGLGREIQNIAFYLITFRYGDLESRRDDVEDYFKKYLDLNYDEYIQSYKNFCERLGFEYKESLDLMNKQSECFDNELPSLE